MTGMAANLLAVQLAKDQLGIQLTWGGWTLAAFAPCVAAFLILPWFTKLLIRPTMNHTPEVKVHGKEMLAELGPLSTQEKKVAVGFILALLGWGTAILTGFNANAIGIAVVAYLMVTKALEWKDALAEKAAWDTVVWSFHSRPVSRNSASSSGSRVWSRRSSRVPPGSPRSCSSS